MLRNSFLTLLFSFAVVFSSFGQENFVGSFAEPQDGGNIDTALSTFDGATATIVPRSHASEAIGGGIRWRNVLFAIRGVQGRNPSFVLPLTSPGTGKTILSGDLVSFQSIKLVWSYEPNAVKWNSFDRHTRTGSGSSTWKVAANNIAPFEQDVIYVSINEHYPVADFYEWLEAEVFTHAMVKPTSSEVTPGTFVIGYQSGAPASASFSRPIPDMPLFGFVIKDPAATGTKLVMLVSGQHPYEGQNKVALQAAIDWILSSSSAEAKAYRAQYTTLVYPFVNPTGELAGLWRGTAFAPSKDTNRNWHTTETIPSRNRGIDTVIVHKTAMQRDIGALNLGEPYAAFDYHQNFGDRPGQPDYVLHSTVSDVSTAPVARRAAATDYAAYYGRISAVTQIADIPSDPVGQDTLRGYMVGRGVRLPLTFERSVYNSIASEWAFGMATVHALADPARVVVITEPAVQPTPTAPETQTPVQTVPPAVVIEPVTTPPPKTDRVVEPDLVLPLSPGRILLSEQFNGSGSLHARAPDTFGPAGAVWMVETGTLSLAPAGVVGTNKTSRAVIETQGADVTVESILNLGADGTGLILRSSNRSNYLRFTLTRTVWLFQKTVAGVTTTVASGRSNFPLKANYTLQATLSGSSVVLSIDGLVVRTLTEPFNQTSTRHGLLSSNTGARTWDSFLVRSLR